MKYLIGFDAGTTSFKCAVYSEAGQVMSCEKLEYRLNTPSPGYVEFPAESYYELLISLLKKTISNARCASDITAVAFSSQGETLVTLDGAGEPTGDCIVWLDNRSTAEAEELSGRFSLKELYEATGQCEFISTWTATKIMWLKKHMPERFAATKKYLLLEDYLVYRLTGRYVTERGLQCSSLLYDMRTGGWWRDMLDYIGLDEDSLPIIMDPGEKVAKVGESIAATLGLPSGTAVVTGALDQVCVAIGVGNIRPGMVSESTGSCLAVCACTDTIPDYREGVRITCQHHAISGKYILLYWAQTAGMVYKWLKEEFYTAAEPGAPEDIYAYMDGEAGTVPPGCGGLLMLPHLEGAQYPEYNSDAKGVIFGLTLRHGRPELARAVLESVSYVLNTIVRDIEEGGARVDAICASGGGARSPLWRRIKASVTGKRVYTSQAEEPACLGAAILAGCGMGVYPSVDDACAKMVKVGSDCESDGEWAAVYRGAYARFQKLYELLLPMYKIE